MPCSLPLREQQTPARLVLWARSLSLLYARPREVRSIFVAARLHVQPAWRNIWPASPVTMYAAGAAPPRHAGNCYCARYKDSKSALACHQRACVWVRLIVKSQSSSHPFHLFETAQRNFTFFQYRNSCGTSHTLLLQRWKDRSKRVQIGWYWIIIPNPIWCLDNFSSKLYHKLRVRSFWNPTFGLSKLNFKTLYHPRSKYTRGD